ncbi:hypothetical protein LPB90_13310 [Chryseobacterium sp. LC2016-29]|uniref:hypothetical protein n=1 Tax=Chryseobacterium sp. LC2016-29 TaxID=2897331 RepID=UPI001E516C6A|nr:hypothetical protein [Chryseobacterium sp. LC2016-29]MCD0479434.1 hypothetical protein [Chryseobacterium sp. LC2016-29]
MKTNNTIFHGRYLFKITFILSSFIFCTLKSQSRTLAITGNNWTVTIPSITEAGSNYAGIYESATNQILLTAEVPLLLASGKVSVSYAPDPTWNSNLVLSAKRTGNGTTVCVLCSITGGTAYQTLTLTDVELFRINAVLALASYSNIPIQLQLSGVSVTIPVATYNSKIIFTISAL